MATVTETIAGPYGLRPCGESTSMQTIDLNQPSLDSESSFFFQLQNGKLASSGHLLGRLVSARFQFLHF